MRLGSGWGTVDTKSHCIVTGSKSRITFNDRSHKAGKSEAGKRKGLMGVSIREKIKGSGEFWIFIRHAGQRVSQLVGEKEVAEDAATEIRTDIRKGRFDIAHMKAARAKAVQEEKPQTPTLSEFFDKTMSP